MNPVRYFIFRVVIWRAGHNTSGSSLLVPLPQLTFYLRLHMNQFSADYLMPAKSICERVKPVSDGVGGCIEQTFSLRRILVFYNPIIAIAKSNTTSGSLQSQFDLTPLDQARTTEMASGWSTQLFLSSLI